MSTPAGPTCTSLMQEGNTAVVTGASSGIGRAACLTYAKAGMNVWMVDIDAEELSAALELVRFVAKDKSKQTLACKVVDVGDAAAMEALAKEVFDKSGKCHILMNNAGIGAGANSMTDIATVQRVINVNTYGPIHGCLAFVPKMKASKEPGMIVNTGSKQGITMPPGNLTYNVSKAALKAYTEGLEHELMKERLEGGNLRAVLLIPGWVNTSIVLKLLRDTATGEFDASSAPFHEEKPAGGAWMPQQVVDFMIQEVDKRRFYIICPDNDVSRKTDNCRMTWTMQDITQDRAPLSRWHPDYKEQFEAFLKEN